MSRSWRLFLRDMLECGRKIERFIGDRDLEASVADHMAYDAVLRNLEVLGEAAKSIPDEVRERHPEVDWRAVSGLRDVLGPRLLRPRRRDPVEDRPRGRPRSAAAPRTHRPRARLTDRRRAA